MACTETANSCRPTGLLALSALQADCAQRCRPTAPNPQFSSAGGKGYWADVIIVLGFFDCKMIDAKCLNKIASLCTTLVFSLVLFFKSVCKSSRPEGADIGDG